MSHLSGSRLFGVRGLRESLATFGQQLAEVSDISGESRYAVTELTAEPTAIDQQCMTWPVGFKTSN